MSFSLSARAGVRGAVGARGGPAQAGGGLAQGDETKMERTWPFSDAP